MVSALSRLQNVAVCCMIAWLGFIVVGMPGHPHFARVSVPNSRLALAWSMGKPSAQVVSVKRAVRSGMALHPFVLNGSII